MPNTKTFRKVITTAAHKDSAISEEELRTVEGHMAHSIQTSRRYYNLPGTSSAVDAHTTIDKVAKKRYFTPNEDNCIIKEWPLKSQTAPSLEACRLMIHRHKLDRKEK